MSIKIREKKLKDGRLSLYLDIYHNGRRSYEFLDIYLTKDKQLNKESKDLAENIRAKRQIELQSRDHNFTPQFKKKINFSDYFKNVYEHKVKHEGFRGVDNYKTTLKHIEDFTKKQGIQIGAIDKKWLEDFKTYLASKMRENTANNYYARVKAVLRRAHKEGYITINPADEVKYFSPIETEKVFLSAGEVAKLAATPAPDKFPQVKFAFLFGCYTGLRFSDIKALQWGDIKDGKLHFRQRKTEGYEYMPLNKTVVSILAKCREENEFPLPEKNIFNIPDKSHVSKYLKVWIKKAGIKKNISFHCSRHTFATSLLTAGADLYTVSKLLGHKSISSTAIYAKVVDEKKRNAVDSLQQVEVVG
jgi:integrase